MKTTKWISIGLFCTLMMFIFTGAAQARFLDKERTLEVKGKISTKATFRTQGSKGFTFPESDAGDMVQHRNLAYIEIDKNWEKESDLDLRLHLVGRLLYEGVYDYGPQEFQDVREANKDEIDDFKKDADLWEAYVDVAPGPLFLRVGRQNVSWGETDLFQMLDRINPLDNTYGGAFEDLDDRRIPLWMARGSYNFGKVGPISSFTLEGFWNPGFVDQKVAPMSPYGTPYAFPAPPAAIATRIIEPEDDMNGSRWGVRLQGVFADNFNFSLAHYKTILDAPAARVVLDPGFIPVQEFIYSDVQITGASLSFFEPRTEAIVRAEVAYFWDEPVFIPEVNAPLLFGTLASGKIPEKDILRFMVGVDKGVWIRALNHKSMINFSLQYFAEWVPDWDDRMRIPAPKFPTGDFVHYKDYEQKMTFIVSTTYRQGTVNPQLAVAYDPRNAWMYMPSVNFIFEPWRLSVAYVGVSGHDDVSFGFNHDRDQFSLSLQLLF